MALHLGKKIKEVLYQKGISVSEFAKAINRSRNVVYDIFERESVDTKLLQKISKVLEHNFFSNVIIANPELSKFQEADLTKLYGNNSKQIKLLETQIEKLKLQNENLKKENAYLKEINILLKKVKSKN